VPYKNREDQRAWAAAYYATNRKKIRASQAVYEASRKEEKATYDVAYAAAHKDQRMAYRAENSEKFRAYAVAYRAANSEKVLASQAAYRSSHKDEKEAYRSAHRPEQAAGCAIRRAKIRGSTIGDHAEIAEIYRKSSEEPNIRCYICNKLIPFGERHVDHIMPLAQNGQHRPSNLAVACSHCNLIKSAKHPNELGILI